MWERRLERLPTLDMGDAELTVYAAATPLARLMGLALLDTPLPHATAIYIPRCRSVHTFGMRFRLDVWWLDKGDEIIDIERDVGPNRIVSNRDAAAVLEWTADSVGRADYLLEPDAQR